MKQTRRTRKKIAKTYVYCVANYYM